MRYATILFCFALGAIPGAAYTQGAPTPTSGMVIQKSTKFRPGVYTLGSTETWRPSGTAEIPDFVPAITIRGNGITVDFTGVVIQGTAPTADPDTRQGLAVRVIGRNVTIKNLTARGYRVGILAKDAKGLQVLDSDLSYNWRQRLLSTPERENDADWMRFHENDSDEWLRYGGAVYLSGCDAFEIRGLKVRGGQNGVLLNRCKNGRIWNSDISFNSGVGIGLYRSNDNRVLHNKIDWNVRGFSYGVYNRGQDSAAVLVFEQCNRNIFAYNSATHSGDGFFLYGGEDTIATGKGGSNDNLLFSNDWSHAPTNGIEATFSRNTFVNNKVHGCEHGAWAGYSYNSLFAHNEFADNIGALLHEHGQNNQYLDNTFARDEDAIGLWAGATLPTWPFAQLRDVRSRDNIVRRNIFNRNYTALNLLRNINTTYRDNILAGVVYEVRVGEGETPPVKRNTTVDVAPVRPWNPWTPFPSTSYLARYNVPQLPKGQNPFLPASAKQGWKYILMDEWGPYDFKRPLIYPERISTPTDLGRPVATPPVHEGHVRYEIFGPKGTWRLVNAVGATFSETSGTVPGFVTIDVASSGHVKVELEYVGAATTDARGVVTPAGQPVPFGFERFGIDLNWNVRFWDWTARVDPNDPDSLPDPVALAALFANGTPAYQTQTHALDYDSYGSFFEGGAGDMFAAVAQTYANVPAGAYTLDVVADDGIRVWVDGQIVLDAWVHQGATSYTVPLNLNGQHSIRIEYFEDGGSATFKAKLRPAF